MSDSTNQHPDKATVRKQKPYEPPAVVGINLRPEEAVLASCKTATAGGGGGPQGSCTKNGGCFVLGS